MGVLGVIFCLIVAVVACCECALIRDEARPVVETEVQLTAEDADAGNWTANLGDIEVEIEHRHGDTSPQKGDFWVMDVTRKLYEEQNSYEESENNALLTEDNDKFRDETEMPQEDIEQSTAEGLVVNKPAEEPSDMSNDIADDDIFALKQRAGIYFPPATDYPIPEDYHVEADIYNNEDNYDSDEVVLDPDNYEYFKGVGWFKLDDRHLNWVDARAACAEVGAHLAVPDTQERVLVFMTLFKRHSDIPARAVLRQQVYVGVSDPGMNRQFTTVQGKPFAPDFPIWFHTEPDNQPPGEYCVTFHIEGRTRDVPCFYTLPFFCEKDIPVVI